MNITFRASLPPIKSAVLLDGMGDGGQVKLEVPRSDVGALLLLQHHFAGTTFTVTIEPEKQVESGEQTGDVATGAERKPEGQAAESKTTYRKTSRRTKPQAGV